MTNTFTARLLLLLESRPLIGNAVYDEIILEVITAYWRDYNDHKSAFMPAFLANDVLRLWRTFCVNYEARTERVPPEKKAKGKLTNYKLKHSRLLTCYSALICLLALYRRNGTVTPSDVQGVVKLSPTQRIEWLLIQEDCERAHGLASQLLDQYFVFLTATNASEADLVTRFMNSNESRKLLEDARKFGDLIYQTMFRIGDGNAFYRLLVV